MKYTNKHLKESYKYSRGWFYIGVISFAIGIVLLLFSFVCAKKQMDNINTLENVLSEQSNSANKIVYIEIIEVPKKISEDEYEGYYLVITDNNTYISGMQEEQFEALKKEVEENGRARLEGFTKVIIDEHVIDDVEKYLKDEHIHIRVTELTYGNILKEGYIVNLILGGIFAIVGVGLLLSGNRGLKKYKNPQAQRIDEECNHKDAIWLNEYKIYLTNSFVVSTYDGISAIDIGTVVEVNLFDTIKDNNTITMLECRTNENKTFELYGTDYPGGCIYEEDIRYLEDVFRSRNINFNCRIETCDDEE